MSPAPSSSFLFFSSTVSVLVLHHLLQEDEHAFTVLVTAWVLFTSLRLLVRRLLLLPEPA